MPIDKNEISKEMLTEEDAEAYLKELEDYELDKETLQKVAGGTLLWDTYFRETSK